MIGFVVGMVLMLLALLGLASCIEEAEPPFKPARYVVHHANGDSSVYAGRGSVCWWNNNGVFWTSKGAVMVAKTDRLVCTDD